MEKLVEKLKTVIQKRGYKERELQKIKDNIQELQKERQERYEALVTDDPKKKQDRAIVAIRRQMPKLREDLEDAKDALVAFNKAVSKKAQDIIAELNVELQRESDESQAEYNKLNQEHLGMLKKANEFGNQKVTPARTKARQSRNLSMNFKSSGWNSEKIVSAIQTPTIFLENPQIGKALGFEDEMKRLQTKRVEQDEILQKQNLRNMNTSEDAKIKSDCALILKTGKFPARLHPFIQDVEVSKEMLVRLLKGIPEEESKVKKEGNTIVDDDTEVENYKKVFMQQENPF